MAKGDGEYKGNQSIADLKKIIKDVTLQKNRALEEKDKLLDEKDKEILRLKNRLSDTENRLRLIQTDDGKIKKVLEERAKGKSVGLIFKELEKISVGLSFEEINSIVNNVTELSIENQKFYKDCIENVKEIKKIDDDFERQVDVGTFQYYQDKLSVALEKFDPSTKEDIKEMLGVIDQGVKLIDKKGKFNKDLKEDTNLYNVNHVNSVMEDFDASQKDMEEEVVVDIIGMKIC